MGNYSGIGHVSMEKDKTKEVWMEKMEEKIKAIQGPSAYGPLGIKELCPTMVVVILKDFKVPDFSNMMVALIHFFTLIPTVLK